MADAGTGINALFNQANLSRSKRREIATAERSVECKQCNGLFVPKKSDRITFCSRDCAFASKAVLAKTWNRKKYSICGVRFPLCNDCGCVFSHPFSGRPHKLCKPCRNKDVISTVKIERECRRCNSVFLTDKKHKQCDLCREGDRRTEADRKRTTRVKPFCKCGNQASSIHASLCTECRRAHRLIDRKAWKHIDRARMREVMYERVNPLIVFQRDNWKCQLCGVSTPKRLRGKNEPASPELDHIVPLAAGGEHSYRNTHCACRKCNGSKWARPLGQLRLFG